jgi:hypothetical protein
MERPSRRHLLLADLALHPEEAEGNEHAERGADTEGDGGALGLEECAAEEGTDEEGENGEDLVVAGDDVASPVEELRVGHELTPHRRKDDWSLVSIETKKS